MQSNTEIDVFLKGVLVTTVPKASEQYIRRHYSGKPEERVLSITPHGYKEDPDKLKKIVSKLQ